MTYYPPQPVRIPNLPSGKFVNENGMPTPEVLTFFESLLTLLNSVLGNEGLVLPSQTGANITTIQNNAPQTQGAAAPTYTCQFGTMIYQTDTSGTTAVKIAVNNGSGVPIFKTVTLT